MRETSLTKLNMKHEWMTKEILDQLNEHRMHKNKNLKTKQE